MRVSLVIALLSAAMTVGAARLPAPPAGGPARGEIVARAAGLSGALTATKLQRAQAGKLGGARLGPVVPSTGAAMPRPRASLHPDLV